jgi:putative oxidoreductase
MSKLREMSKLIRRPLALGGATRMGVLGLSPLSRLAELAPLAVRLIVGIVMAAHGWHKLLGGPANFGEFLAQLGVPLPGLMAYVVTFVELVGGLLLVVGLLSRLSALLLTATLVVATLLVKVNVGLIVPHDQPGVGAELDLALIAGFLVILLAGPGRLSLDQALGIDQEAGWTKRQRRAERTDAAS